MSNIKEYIQQLQAQLDAQNAEIDKLEAKAEGASADVKIEFNNKVKELRAQQNMVTEKLPALMESGEEAWEELKAVLDSALDTMSQAISSVASKFK